MGLKQLYKTVNNRIQSGAKSQKQRQTSELPSYIRIKPQEAGFNTTMATVSVF